MSNEIRADYSQQFLLPPSLDNWLPKDHPARFVGLFVDNLDLKALGFEERKNKEGRPPYSNDLLLKVWLYGFFEKIYSTRDLEKACKVQLPFFWLTGVYFPDHNTLWRFHDKYKSIMNQVFRQSVQIAVKGDLVSLVLQAIDGTKMFADVSGNRALNLKDLKKLLELLDKSVDEVFEKISHQAALESSEVGDITNSYSLPREYQDKRKLKKLIKEGLDELNHEEKQKLKQVVDTQIQRMEEAGLEHLNLTDGDARMMKTPKGDFSFCYNAQAAVDSENQIIVGAKVSNDPTDHHLLTDMIDESVSNTGQVCEETVADGGYLSGEELQIAEDKGYPVLVNMSNEVKGKGKTNPKGQEKEKEKNKSSQSKSENESASARRGAGAGAGTDDSDIESDGDGNRALEEEGEGEEKALSFHKRAFSFDEAKDIYVCPAGKELTFERINNGKSRAYPVRIYRCRHHKNCQYKKGCSSDKRGRTIERSPYEKSLEAQIEKQKDVNHRMRLKRRSQIVEPVFGWIKRNNRFFRWAYRGLESVDAQWQLICTVINLKTLYRKWLEGEFESAFCGQMGKP
jgi:transposase